MRMQQAGARAQRGQIEEVGHDHVHTKSGGVPQ